ncbi:hypothetical protein [Ancylobacter sp.]|uniref:hypothetical protein n=1 Tax=Ancylobacter sp. TaxID=1872567 RepID=UPI003C7AE884
MRSRFPGVARLRGAARQYVNDLRLPSLAADRRAFARGIAQQNESLAALTVGGQASAPTYKVTQRQELPPLAWLCRREGAHFAFSGGQGVELFDGGLFEGVWTGAFGDSGGLEQASHFGSGALFGAVPLFLPPKHLLEAIYLLRDRRRGVDHISNSLCFCLAAAGIAPGHPFFAVVEAEAVDNTHAATRLGAAWGNPVIASSSDFVLLRLGHNNFTVSAAGQIVITQRYTGRRYRDFDAYRRMLGDAVTALRQNAESPLRRVPLAPVVTVSRGYDSPTVAALAAERGCREALTMRVEVGGGDDCGTDIAQALGMHVREVGHAAGSHIPTLRFAYEGELRAKALEFLATAGHGDDIAFVNFEPHLGNTMLFTGAWGDSIWERQSNVPSGLPVRTLFGKSLGEFRLRVGFAHVPLPCIGAFYPHSIARLSRSRAMAPYATGMEGYDRPICRRIVEGAGVEGSAFGQKKVATAPNPLNRAALWAEAVTSVMARYSATVEDDAGANGGEAATTGDSSRR